MFITSPVRNPETLAHPALTIHAYTISDHSILSQTEITQRWPTQLVYLSELSLGGTLASQRWTILTDR